MTAPYLPKLPKPPKSPRRASIPKPPRPTIFPEGPKALHLDTKPVFVGGPGEPPAAFLERGYNSRDEWPPYWAFSKIKGPEGSGWYYQRADLGGRKLPGGAVVDFAVVDQSPPLAVRIQTERFHIATNFRKQAADREQRIALSNAGWIVLDIFSYTYLGDPTGKKVIQLVNDILGGRMQPSPLTTGVTSVRPA